MISIATDVVFAGMLVFCRASGLVAIMPIFSATSIPVQIRVAVSALLAFTVSGSAAPGIQIPEHWIGVVTLAFHEVLAGLLLGLAGRLVFAAVEFAGQVISTDMGLMMSSSVDPLSRSNSSPAQTLLYSLATVLFFVTGAHHLCFFAFARSFEVFPTGAAFDPRAADVVIHESGRIFLVAVQLAAPMIAIGFLTNLAFSILGRAAPSINAFQQSFAVKILVGLSTLGLTFGIAAYHLLGELRTLPETMLRFLR